MENTHFSKDICVLLFLDIHHYSKILVFLGDRHGEFIQDFYETMGDIIVKNNGEIIKYVGDSIYAIFPENFEAKAIECALYLRKTYLSLIKKYGITFNSVLESGIGTGEIVRGVFGHSSLRVKDFFGEKVMETEMIMHHRGVAVTNDVYEKVKDLFELKHLPDLKLKWRDNPLVWWSVIKGKS